ncbi:MAG: AraC family transcriptional regulator [Clostridiaceae bacterium]|nr:AraC family transcriptional regulator [Clostridiaceae bacterium]
MEWLKHLSSAIDYIENNLTGEISYDTAAQTACCSTYNFQRIFSYMAGISLSEYIRRRKMTQAAFELQSTNQKVLDIALKYGYTSPTSFNRAFQSVHGISPVLAKSEGCLLNAYPPIRFSLQMTGGTAMAYRIEQKEELRIVGIRTPMTEDMEHNREIIPGFWDECLHHKKHLEIGRLSNLRPDGILGVSVCEGPASLYYYIASASSLPAPEGMTEYLIPAATWVIFESDGPYKESVHNIFKRFLTEWLPFSGYAYAELPDIEVYPFAKDKPAFGHTQVWIAVKKEKEF